MKTNNLKSWEIQVGSKLWLVLCEKKPTIKESKIKGKRFDLCVVDEHIEYKDLPNNLK